MTHDASKLHFRSKPVPGRISVVMPCYNAERHLRESICSVLDQTYTDVELVVVDDGSSDGSPGILIEFKSRITTIRQENRGPGPARNRGLEAGSGEFFAFLDADDYWDPACLHELHQALNGSDAELAYCGWKNVGASARGRPYVPPDYEAEDKAIQFLREAAPWPIHAALVRRRVLKRVDGFDEKWPSCMDYDLWLRIGIRWPIKRVERVLAYYRHHGDTQITAIQWRQAYNVWRVKKHFVQQFAELASHISPGCMRELIDGALLKRGFELYWKRDLISAHKIFRMTLKNRYWTVKDLRYLLPALLPEALFIRLITLIDKRS